MENISNKQTFDLEQLSNEQLKQIIKSLKIENEKIELSNLKKKLIITQLEN